MEKIDARKLSRKGLQARRQRVIELYQEKMPAMKIVEVSGLSWPAVHAAIKHYEAGNTSAEMPSQRGRKKGTGRVLSEEQEAELFQIICRKRPWQIIKLSHRRSLWDRDAVMQLIEQRYGVKLSLRCLDKYLERWGFTEKKKRCKRPYDHCSKEVKEWLDENYTKIQQRSKDEDADIYWVRRSTLTYVDGDKIKRLPIIMTATNQRKERWLVINGQYTPKNQIKFLTSLTLQSKKLIFLICENSKDYSTLEFHDYLKSPNILELFTPSV